MNVLSLVDIAARAEIARAAAATRAIVYKLGKGGFDPKSEFPWNPTLACDCSGFVAWCMGLPRHYAAMPGDGEWIETSAIYADARKGQVVFLRREFAEPGCLIVWPDRKTNGTRREGHVGVVSQVAPDMLGVMRPTKVIHCSAGNARTGTAIKQTGPEIFEKNAATVVALRFPVKVGE